jgi:hypothetical protein
MPRRSGNSNNNNKVRARTEITKAGTKPLSVGQVTWTHLCDAKGTLKPAGYVGRKQVDWDRRYSHAAVSLKDAMFILGGSDVNGSPCSDVWRSVDGVKWELMTTNAWPARSNHAAVVLDEKIFVLGGFGAGAVRYNDVWCSSDGRNWAQVRTILHALFSHLHICYSSVERCCPVVPPI